MFTRPGLKRSSAAEVPQRIRPRPGDPAAWGCHQPSHSILPTRAKYNSTPPEVKIAVFGVVYPSLRESGMPLNTEGLRKGVEASAPRSSRPPLISPPLGERSGEEVFPDLKMTLLKKPQRTQRKSLFLTCHSTDAPGTPSHQNVSGVNTNQILCVLRLLSGQRASCGETARSRSGIKRRSEQKTCRVPQLDRRRPNKATTCEVVQQLAVPPLSPVLFLP